MCYFPGRDIVLDVGVLCNSEDITLTLTVTTDFFNGMIYPKGLSKNSTCMTEYIQQEASVHYPLNLPSRKTWDIVGGQSRLLSGVKVPVTCHHHCAMWGYRVTVLPCSRVSMFNVIVSPSELTDHYAGCYQVHTAPEVLQHDVY